jgi:hypothetical protein
LALALGLGCVLGPGLLVAAAVADTEAPTVIFSSTGVPPVSCGSRPNVTSLSVPEGTPIVIENQVGVGGWVHVGDEPVIEIADTASVLLTLAAGQHDVLVVPACLVVGNGAVKPVAVTVTGGPTSSDPPATGPPATTGVTPSAAVPSGSGGASPAVIPARTAVGQPSATASGGPDSAAVLAVRQVERDANPKGVRLLAAVATICVLGVTAAIIRSIVRLAP